MTSFSFSDKYIQSCNISSKYYFSGGPQILTCSAFIFIHFVILYLFCNFHYNFLFNQKVI